MFKKEIKLKDYNNIWSKFCFLDESGTLNIGADPFFTIGLIKCTQPYYLYSKILYERNKRQFYDEMKFNKVSNKNINFLKFVIESFLEAKSYCFYSYTVDKDGHYFKTEFNSDGWKAYEEISLRVLDAAWGGENEILILIADHVTTPKNIHYEVSVKRIFNQNKKRLALAGVCRFDSKGNELLQVVDLFIGAINYDLKLKAGLVKGDKNKKELFDFIKVQLGVSDFISGYRDRKFNIFVDKDVKNRF